MSGHGANAPDEFNLERFVRAQQGIFESACAEMQRGLKRGHWMWFIFPQIAGLGQQSSTSTRFAIASIQEARAYLAHPILGPRLKEISSIVSSLKGTPIGQVLGPIDSMKLKSSMTLFAHATADNQPFLNILQVHFGGQFDPLTLKLLEREKT